ncbi:hypothetical protein [Nocardia sp. NPDC051833]|uniref:hypothetical protein n=1 Tax=Nocardia sp. NPDC051833 TaxID=3155674 RepID=UPI0034283F91
MTNSRNRTTTTPSMDLTNTIIMLATCVFFLFGLVTLKSPMPLALAGATGLAAAMAFTMKTLGPTRRLVGKHDR